MKKLGKHRTRLNILATVLTVISENNGAKKTQIMYKAYLSYKLLTRYLNDVISAGMVTCEDENCYMLTKKGEKFLEEVSEYHKYCKNVAKQLSQVEDQRAILEKMCSGSRVTKVND